MQNPYLWAVWCPPGGFIASWALGTCPQRCHVSLFGSSTLREKSVPWQSTPNSAAQWVKSQERPCFFCVSSFIDRCFFIFVLCQCSALIWTASPDTLTGSICCSPQGQAIRLRESLKQHFPEAQDVAGRWRETTSQRHCCLQWQRHSHPSDEFCYCTHPR